MPRPQFTLRALLVATLVAGASLGPLVNHAHRQRREVRFVESLGGQIAYDFQFDEHGYHRDGTLNVPQWLIALVGVDFFAEVVSVRVPLKKCSINVMARLEQIPTLQAIDVRGPGITDAGIEHLAGHKCLERLWLSGSRISDRAIVHLSRIPKLKRLVIGAAGVSDASVDTLISMRQLESLSLVGTRITRHGAKRLKSELTGCDIDIGRFM